MNTKIKYLLLSFLGLFVVEAKALVLQPADACFDNTDLSCMTDYGSSPANPDAATIAGMMQTDPLDLLFKANVGGSNEGPYADDYVVTFGLDPLDPDFGILNQATGANDSIGICVTASCFLSVKDGKHDPSLYVFDISGWDGLETISMTNFWPDQGGISNVAIWGPGTSTDVPEPGTLALFGLGLLGLALGRKKIA